MTVAFTSSPPQADHWLKRPAHWRRAARTLACGLLPIALGSAIWLPEWLHFRIDRSDPAPAVLAPATARPGTATLDELGRIDLAEIDHLEATAQGVAESAAAGFVDIAGLSGGRIALQGYPADYQRGPPTFQLFMASLSLERLLLQAYRETGQSRWLRLALQRAEQLAEHERQARHEVTFLWNDHALANRVSVLIQLWALVRLQADLRAEHGPWLLAFAQRSGRMLAKPGQFTVRTNHGVMQNIALLQLAAAFPDLRESIAWRDLAVERLKLQRGFYVSPDGVVLEHSAGYHAMGTALLAHAHRLMQLNGLPVDPALAGETTATRQVLAQLMRPDGSLPAVGNTDPGLRHDMPSVLPDGSMPVEREPPPQASASVLPGLLPAAGWAVWWSGDRAVRESQLLVTWAKHDGHGHKHADEGALVFWSGGTDWLTAVGYWPYGAPLLPQSYGWNSSNAVHEPGETTKSRREASLLASGQTDQTRFVDILRRLDSGTTFRRQVLQLDSHTLLVLDFASGAKQGSETTWTVGPALRLAKQSGRDMFATDADARGHHLRMALVADSELTTRLLRGSTQPYGGWTTLKRVPEAVDALRIVNRKPSSVTMALFHVSGVNGKDASLAPVAADITAEQWQTTVSVGPAHVEIARRDDELQVRRGEGQLTTLRLTPPAPAVAAQRLALHAAYDQAVNRFPPWRALLSYRLALSQKLVALWLLLEGARFAAMRLAPRVSRSHGIAMDIGLALLWLTLLVYVPLIYLKA